METEGVYMGFALSRIKIKLPSGNEIITRRIAPQDMLLCGLTPDLTKQADASPARIEDMRALLEKMVVRAAVEPKFCLDEKDAVPDKVIWVGELAYDELDLIAGGIFRASGITAEAKEEIIPLDETLT